MDSRGDGYPRRVRLHRPARASSTARAGEIEIGEMDFEEPTAAELERRKRLAAA
jgi:hypothetical protein